MYRVTGTLLRIVPKGNLRNRRSLSSRTRIAVGTIFPNGTFRREPVKARIREFYAEREQHRQEALDKARQSALPLDIYVLQSRQRKCDYLYGEWSIFYNWANGFTGASASVERARQAVVSAKVDTVGARHNTAACRLSRELARRPEVLHAYPREFHGWSLITRPDPLPEAALELALLLVDRLSKKELAELSNELKEEVGILKPGRSVEEIKHSVTEWVRQP